MLKICLGLCAILFTHEAMGQSPKVALGPTVKPTTQSPTSVSCMKIDIKSEFKYYGHFRYGVNKWKTSSSADNIIYESRVNSNPDSCLPNLMEKDVCYDFSIAYDKGEPVFEYSLIPGIRDTKTSIVSYQSPIITKKTEPNSWFIDRIYFKNGLVMKNQVECFPPPTPMPTPAPTRPSGYEIRNHFPPNKWGGRGKFTCADVAPECMRSNGCKVVMWNCHGGSNQDFYGVFNKGGFHNIKHRPTGKCLQVDPNVAGDHVHVWDCNGSDKQKWTYFDRTGLGDGYIKSTDGKCWEIPALDWGNNGGEVRLSRCLERDNQGQKHHLDFRLIQN